MEGPEGAEVIALWAEGRPAPYPLFEDGGALVEAVGDDREPVINRGDEISPELAARVAAMAAPLTVVEG